MHTGKAYRLREFLWWTRRDIYVLVVLGILAVLAYEIAGLTWLSIPWPVVALLGTATAFVVGFKNLQTYSRAWEARQVWGDIVSSSKAWGLMSRDYFDDPGRSKELIYRHLAWLSVLRYEMRESRTWESTGKAYNAEYRRLYSIPEKETSLEKELARYFSPAELEAVIAANSKTTFLMSQQSKTLTELFRDQKIVVLQFIDMQRALKELLLHQGRSERIKEFPYPRQYATVSGLFVTLFCVLLPFGMLREFEALNESVEGLMKGHMVWLAIPFSVLISWMYTSLEQVGQSTENPFEGSPNDVPISQLSRTVERDLREVLGETDLPLPLNARNQIVL